MKNLRSIASTIIGFAGTLALVSSAKSNQDTNLTSFSDPFVMEETCKAARDQPVESVSNAMYKSGFEDEPESLPGDIETITSLFRKSATFRQQAQCYRGVWDEYLTSTCALKTATGEPISARQAILDSKTLTEDEFQTYLAILKSAFDLVDKLHDETRRFMEWNTAFNRRSPTQGKSYLALDDWCSQEVHRTQNWERPERFDSISGSVKVGSDYVAVSRTHPMRDQYPPSGIALVPDTLHFFSIVPAKNETATNLQSGFPEALQSLAQKPSPSAEEISSISIFGSEISQSAQATAAIAYAQGLDILHGVETTAKILQQLTDLRIKNQFLLDAMKKMINASLHLDQIISQQTILHATEDLSEETDAESWIRFIDYVSRGTELVGYSLVTLSPTDPNKPRVSAGDISSSQRARLELPKIRDQIAQQNYKASLEMTQELNSAAEELDRTLHSSGKQSDSPVLPDNDPRLPPSESAPEELDSLSVVDRTLSVLKQNNKKINPLSVQGQLLRATARTMKRVAVLSKSKLDVNVLYDSYSKVKQSMAQFERSSTFSRLSVAPGGATVLLQGFNLVDQISEGKYDNAAFTGQAALIDLSRFFGTVRKAFGGLETTSPILAKGLNFGASIQKIMSPRFAAWTTAIEQIYKLSKSLYQVSNQNKRSALLASVIQLPSMATPLKYLERTILNRLVILDLLIANVQLDLLNQGALIVRKVARGDYYLKLYKESLVQAHQLCDALLSPKRTPQTKLSCGLDVLGRVTVLDQHGVVRETKSDSTSTPQEEPRRSARRSDPPTEAPSPRPDSRSLPSGLRESAVDRLNKCGNMILCD